VFNLCHVLCSILVWIWNPGQVTARSSFHKTGSPVAKMIRNTCWPKSVLQLEVRAEYIGEMWNFCHIGKSAMPQLRVIAHPNSRSTSTFPLEPRVMVFLISLVNGSRFARGKFKHRMHKIAFANQLICLSMQSFSMLFELQNLLLNLAPFT
jgi:hypothetical protein